MSERITLHHLESLSKMPKKTFHLMCYEEQLAVTQNTVIEKEGTEGFVKPLRAKDVDQKETKIVNLLLNSEYVGPFASTYFEGPYAWMNYINFSNRKINNSFEIASKKGLWEKYLGMSQYDPHWMGGIVHTVSLITKSFSSDKNGFRQISPADYAPSYAEAVKDLYKKKNSLFIGAFSLKSVSDIWGINNHILGNNDMKIIDINGGLSEEAAKHYEIPFIKSDGLGTCFRCGSYDLVFTNNICCNLDWCSWDYNPNTLKSKRKNLFQEISRITNPKGKLIMVEEPISSNTNEHSWKEEIDLDSTQIKMDLNNTGFTDIKVTTASSFKSRVNTDKFLQTGIIDSSDIEKKHDARFMFLITANKR